MGNASGVEIEEQLDDLFGKLHERLREKFIQVISRTTTADAIRLSVVSKSFQSAADSDFVWDCLASSLVFLPLKNIFFFYVFTHFTKMTTFIPWAFG